MFHKNAFAFPYPLYAQVGRASPHFEEAFRIVAGTVDAPSDAPGDHDPAATSVAPGVLERPASAAATVDVDGD